MSDTHFYNKPLDADSIDGPRSSHLGCDPLDIRGVARRHPQSEDGCYGTSLNVDNDIVGGTPPYHELGSPDACAVARYHPQSEGGCHSTSQNVGNDIIVETLKHQ